MIEVKADARLYATQEIMEASGLDRNRFYYLSKKGGPFSPIGGVPGRRLFDAKTMAIFCDSAKMWKAGYRWDFIVETMTRLHKGTEATR